MQVGDTVSLRVHTRAGPTEIVGTVLVASADALTLRRRDGTTTEIAVSQITAGRVVPPSPAQRIEAAELEWIASRGWLPPDHERLGDWLLRAGGGVTGRANSALTVGDPGRPVEDAVAAVADWYDARGLPPRVQVPEGAAPAGLPDVLDELGWSVSIPTHVMTAELGPVLRGRPSEPPIAVALDEQLDDAWLASWRADTAGHDLDAARAILTNHGETAFASVREGGRCLAIARVAVDGRWAGLFCVEVAAGARRRGLARAVNVASLRWAVARGARRAYLQTQSDNTPAIALYESMGFAVHHDYRYWVAPAT